MTNMISFPPDFCEVESSVQDIVENVFPEILNNYETINGFVNEPYWHLRMTVLTNCMNYKYINNNYTLPLQIIIFLYNAIINFSSSFISYRIPSDDGYFS
jgi:hypothetical protein